MHRTRMTMVTLAVIVSLLGLAAPTASATTVAAPSTTVTQTAALPTMADVATAGTGNVFYTKLRLYNSSPILTGNIRYSWSFMWKLKNGWTTNAAAAGIACAFMPSGAAKTACTAYALYVGLRMKSAVNTAISHRKCLVVTFGLPPYPPYAAGRLWETTCTI